MRRRGRPSLIGTAARTAVIAGTATAVSGKVARNMAPPPGYAPAAPQPVSVPPAAPHPPMPAAPALTAETIEKLKQLGDLRTAGVLNDQEFAQAKAKLLG